MEKHHRDANILVHGYADVEDEELWKVIEVDLDPLHKSIERILATEEL